MTLFSFRAKSLEKHNKQYMLEQLNEPDEPDMLYRAWPNSEGDRFYIESYRIIRRTPKGAWIDNGGQQKFVNFSWAKRWACPTRTKAVESLLRRMARWERLLTRDLERARKMQATIAAIAAK